MCIGCWQEYGSPALVNDNTVRAAGLIDRVYTFYPSGGHLHVVIDDWNLDDDCLVSAAKYDLTPVEQDCLSALQALTEDERATAMAIHDGFIYGIQKKEVQYG